MDFDYDKLNECDKDEVDLLKQIYTMNVMGLMDVNRDQVGLDDFLHKFILCFYSYILFTMNLDNYMMFHMQKE